MKRIIPTSPTPKGTACQSLPWRWVTQEHDAKYQTRTKFTNWRRHGRGHISPHPLCLKLWNCVHIEYVEQVFKCFLKEDFILFGLANSSLCAKCTFLWCCIPSLCFPVAVFYFTFDYMFAHGRQVKEPVIQITSSTALNEVIPCSLSIWTHSTVNMWASRDIDLKTKIIKIIYYCTQREQTDVFLTLLHKRQT